MARLIAKALAEFQLYLTKSFGKKIDISLLREFAVMVNKIMDAIHRDGK